MNAPRPPRRRRIAGEPKPSITGTGAPAVAADDRSAQAARHAPTARARRFERRRLIAFAFTAVVLMVGVVVAAWGFGRMQAERPLSYDAAQQAAAAAGTAVEEIFTYDYGDIDEYADRTSGLITPRYAEAEYEGLVEALREQAVATRAQMDTTVHAAATLPCTDGCSNETAKVLVVTDRVTLNAAQSEPVVAPQRLEVSMVHEGGRWLVDEVTYLGE